MGVVVLTAPPRMLEVRTDDVLQVVLGGLLAGWYCSAPFFLFFLG